ncbi:TauD/TfdA family dioxygenase [Verticiella sediminum]|uniref:TauD/TfdA family dioxygenase n=1 Tax=Verticiella sediminum TaxID=1247510 RepID=A0A556AWP9_9BURK|nr:TauD/TfdA family dioxygenase [Verticiella sediminum]TSH97357.1 TauD/TfdA family dioxygenase [Verticiella sediminum]
MNATTAPQTRPDAPAPWTAREAQADRGWVRRLSPAARADLGTATRHARATGKPLLQLRQADYPLADATRAELRQAFDATQGRWGMCLLKGLPVREWDEADTRLALWGIGLHNGVPRPQNRASEVLNDVRDEGGSYRVTNGRGYNTNQQLDFHIDFCDVVALLCRRTARQGGDSLVASSLAIVETMRRLHPQQAQALEEPIPFSWQGGQAPGDAPLYLSPMLGRADDGTPAFRTNRKNIVAAQRDFPDAPRLTPAQQAAVETVDRLAASPELCFSMQLEEGDLQLLNNYVLIHSRTAFEDHAEADEKRHLLRLWLALPQAQALPASWADAFKDVRAGAVRGGLRGQNITPAFLALEQAQAQAFGMHERYATEQS